MSKVGVMPKCILQIVFYMIVMICPFQSQFHCKEYSICRHVACKKSQFSDSATATETARIVLAAERIEARRTFQVCACCASKKMR